MIGGLYDFNVRIVISEFRHRLGKDVVSVKVNACLKTDAVSLDISELEHDCPVKIGPVTDLEKPRRFQELRFPK